MCINPYQRSTSFVMILEPGGKYIDNESCFLELVHTLLHKPKKAAKLLLEFLQDVPSKKSGFRVAISSWCGEYLGPHVLEQAPDEDRICLRM